MFVNNKSTACCTLKTVSGVEWSKNGTSFTHSGHLFQEDTSLLLKGYLGN
jgi:hypothetical protein